MRALADALAVRGLQTLRVAVMRRSLAQFGGCAPHALLQVAAATAGARTRDAACPWLVGSSSPYVDGQRVTLIDIDFDQLLRDESVLSRLQEAKTQEPGESRQKTKSHENFDPSAGVLKHRTLSGFFPADQS